MEIVILIVLVAAVLGVVVAFRRRAKPVTSEGFDDRGDSVASDDSEGDSWEGGFWEAPDPKRLSADLEIDYKDARGNQTRRRVRVREFDNQLYGGILIAHCALRGATRTFRFDRIRRCVDVATGEVVRDVHRYLNEVYEASPERSKELLVTDYLDTIKILYFVAKADGQYRQAEKEVVERYVQSLVRDERVDASMIDDALRMAGVPTIQGFKLALGRVLKSGDVDPKALLECCKAIVATQKSVHPVEQEALDYFERKIG